MGKTSKETESISKELRQIQPQINVYLRRQKHTMDYTNSTLPPRNGGRVQVAGETQDTERHTTQLWMEITSEPWLLE